jgi:hypothetical protein
VIILGIVIEVFAIMGWTGWKKRED